MFRRLFFLLFLVLVTPNLHAQNLLENGDFARGLSSWRAKSNGQSRFEARENRFVAQIEIAPDAKPWDATLHQNLPQRFSRGETLVFSGRARSTNAQPLYGFIEDNGAPFEKRLTVRLPLSSEWQPFSARAVLPRDFAPYSLSAGFQLAQRSGTLEIADLKLERAPLDWAQIEARPTLFPSEVFAENRPAEKRLPVSGNFPLRSEIVSAQHPNFSRALRISANAPRNSNLWDARISGPKNPDNIERGDLILVSFWARSDSKNRVSPVFQRAEAPFDKVLQEIAPLSPEWKRFLFYASAKTDFAPETTAFELQIGELRGSLEIAELRVQNLGAVPIFAARERFSAPTIELFGGAKWDDLSWRKAAQQRIEKHRKAPLKIRVFDANGRPIRGAKIEINQTRHAFRFGTAVNKTLLEESENGRKYREFVRRNFNTAVLENDHKWRQWDGNEAVQNRADASVKWLRENGLEVRGHTLVWGAWRFLPPRIEKLPSAEARREIEAWTREIVGRNRGQIYVWDVVNEAARNTELFDRIGWDVFPQIYRWAREADPTARLAYNDYDISNEGPDGGKLRATVEERIETLRKSGAPLDVLGDQAHLFTPLTPIPRVIEIWESWRQKWNLPLEITEFDVAIADDEAHAQYFADFLTAAFAQPNVESFVMWGFWENAHWRGADAAMLRADWSKRPAQLAYENLVFKEWQSDAISSSDARGQAETRAFLGDYEITVSSGEKSLKRTAKLTRNGLELEFRLSD